MSSYEPPERLKHVFDFYGIDPEHRPGAAEDITGGLGYVYIIQCQEFFKIGVADDPEARLVLLQVGSPYELRLIKVYASADPVADERVLQARLARYHERGEWYLLPESVLKALLALDDITVLSQPGRLANDYDLLLKPLPPRPRFYRFVVRLEGERVFAGRVGTISSASATYIRASRWNRIPPDDQATVEAAIKSYQISLAINGHTYTIEYPRGTPQSPPAEGL